MAEAEPDVAVEEPAAATPANVDEAAMLLKALWSDGSEEDGSRENILPNSSLGSRNNGRRAFSQETGENSPRKR